MPNIKVIAFLTIKNVFFYQNKCSSKTIHKHIFMRTKKLKVIYSDTLSTLIIKKMRRFYQNFTAF